jgi:hypothetical protein
LLALDAYCSFFFYICCHTWTSRRPIKNYHSIGKKKDIWHLVLLGENVLFKESPPSIMVTRNPNWSTEILWYGTGYTKEKMLSSPKRPTWGRLHCWFCLKLLKNLFFFFPFLFFLSCSWLWHQWTIPTNNSNSGVGKYRTNPKKYNTPDSSVSEYFHKKWI